MPLSARVLSLLLLSLFATSAPGQARKVVVYVSHDQEHSQGIIELFEERSGISVQANYDTEDTKTIGLVNSLIAAKDAPVADVFWNNECGHSVRLRNKGLLQAYESPSARTIPAAFKDPNHFWTGFGARARVLAYNTDLINPAELPQSLSDLTNPQWRGRLGMAKPLTGTTRTQVGALYASWGEERTNQWLDAMQANEVRWELGNGPVAQAVAEGAYPIGMTDTDDVNGRRQDGLPIAAHYLGQGEGGEGCLVIPNSVMMMKGAPNPAEAKALIDFLLTPEVEQMLAEGRAAQMPLHPNVPAPDYVRPVSELKAFAVSFEDTGAKLEAHGRALEARFTLAGTGRKSGEGASSLWISLAVIVAIGGVIALSMKGRNRE